MVLLTFTAFAGTWHHSKCFTCIRCYGGKLLLYHFIDGGSKAARDYVTQRVQARAVWQWSQSEPLAVPLLPPQGVRTPQACVPLAFLGGACSPRGLLAAWAPVKGRSPCQGEPHLPSLPTAPLATPRCTPSWGPSERGREAEGPSKEPGPGSGRGLTSPPPGLWK